MNGLTPFTRPPEVVPEFKRIDLYELAWRELRKVGIVFGEYEPQDRSAQTENELYR